MPVKMLKTAAVFLLIISLLFIATRLINLTVIPIFTDEAIYLRWAQIAAGDPKWRFISLIDGKQPLLIWLFLGVFKIISGDPLVLGRLVSVGLGFIAMLGFAAFSWYLTRSAKGAVIGALAYLTIPFFLLYDRLAIYEALFNALTIWTLFATYIFGKTLRLDVALITGSLIGFGLLTKSYANFFLILLPATLLLVPWARGGNKKILGKWVGLVAVIFIQAQIYQNILRLSEFRHIVGQKNLQFIYSFTEFIQNPLKSGAGNFYGLSSWLVSYLTLPIFLIAVGGSIWYIKSFKRPGVFFLIYFLVPFVALAFFGKVIYPRFLLFMVPAFIIPLIIMLTHIWNKKKNLILYKAVLFCILIPALYFDSKLLIDPIRAPLPLADRQQFINDWPAGYGIKEVVAFLETESQKGPLIIGTEGTFGLFPHALELYLGKNVNVTVQAYWPLNEFPKELTESAKEKPTYLVFKERQEAPADWPIKLINQYQRGGGPTYLKFFRVLPQS